MKQKQPKGKLFTIRFEEKTFNSLHAIATRNDRSVGYIVRQAVERFIKEQSR